MDLGLKGKVALVTAASAGLGRAIAEELAGEGCKVVICARGAEKLMDACQTIISETGASVLAVPADVSDPAQCRNLVTEAQAQFGPVQVLVTNAGGPPPGPFQSHEPEAWDAAFRLTLQSAVALTRLVLPAMQERGWGRILNVTSIAVKQPVDNLILSNSMRAAVTGFARTLANEVAGQGITVNNLMPGFTRTERIVHLANATAERDGTTVEDVYKGWEQQIPMARIGEPREFAALAAFLASERASYITAQSIAVDGGWIRGLL